MRPERFLEQFGYLADAPNGIAKLRELILQLAVQGKLVAQDPNAEPADVLLERIRADKERLVAEGKIKKTRPRPAVNLKKMPFEVPEGWNWVFMETISTQIHYGYTASADRSIRNVLLLRITDIQDNQVDWDTVPGCEIDDKALQSYRLANDDILVARTGGTIGKTYLVENLDATAVFASYLIRIVRSTSMIARFLKRYCESPLYWNQLLSAASGTGQPNVNGNSLKSLTVPIPPVAEQSRIVTKVDQLMALCDELKVKQNQRAETRVRLIRAAHQSLTQPRDHAEFQTAWKRIRDNFNGLHTTVESVKALRQTILQLAVQGKLVPQDSIDEPASVLLEKISAEKDQLVGEGKIRKRKPLPAVEPETEPFPLPASWCWTRLGNVLLKVTDGTHHSPPNTSTGDFKYVTAKNIKNFGVDLSDITYVTEAIHNEIFQRCNPELGDILFIKDGATTGIVTINDLAEPFSMLSSVSLLKPPRRIDNRYLLYFLRSPYFYASVRGDMSGVAITRVTLKKLDHALIPVAPSAEQHRIVAKVDQLMTLCDKLEAKIETNQAKAQYFAEAVVAELAA